MENLLEQKKAFKRRLAAWEAQQATQQAKVWEMVLLRWCALAASVWPQQEAELAAAAQEAKLLAFDRQNHAGATARLAQQLEQTIQVRLF